MSKDDDDNIIDITNYVNNSISEEEQELETFANQFVTMINESIVERHKKIARDRFVHLMINFLLLTQAGVVIAITFIMLKLYS